MPQISIETFLKDLSFEELVKGSLTMIDVTCPDITRPGLHLSGFYDVFNEGCIQVIGKVENSYLLQLDTLERHKKCKEYFQRQFPCLIAADIQPCKEMLLCASESGKAFFWSSAGPTETVYKLSSYINALFAPMMNVHGALVDVFGVGVMILGKSGVGKSETALELIQRGHRLTADDAIFFRRINNMLVGSAPALVRYLMEIRGIGVVNIWEMYGSGAVKLEQELDVVIQLEEWQDDKDYTVIGKNMGSYELLDISVPMITVPVKQGRNIASIIEVAAKNFRLKAMGFDAFEELSERLKQEKNPL